MDILTSPRHVRFTSESGHSGYRTACPLSAISGPRRRIRYLADVTMPHRDRAPNIDHYALAVSQRIASMMTWVERSTSCQTTLRSIPSCVPSSGKMNNQHNQNPRTSRTRLSSTCFLQSLTCCLFDGGLLTARALPTERALSDLDCPEQAVTVADFECYCSARFCNVPSYQGNIDRISRARSSCVS